MFNACAIPIAGTFSSHRRSSHGAVSGSAVSGSGSGSALTTGRPWLHHHVHVHVHVHACMHACNICPTSLHATLCYIHGFPNVQSRWTAHQVRLSTRLESVPAHDLSASPSTRHYVLHSGHRGAFSTRTTCRCSAAPTCRSQPRLN